MSDMEVVMILDAVSTTAFFPTVLDIGSPKCAAYRLLIISSSFFAN